MIPAGQFGIESVARQLGLSDTDPQRSMLDGPVAAVGALVPQWCGVSPDNWPSWPANVAEGATMLAARLHRRRNSPSGVESFGELGPVYVQRNDPDVAMLLGLGAWTPPRVG
ncbi:head-to-tail adaptor [Gordonia phage Schiebs]|nr:head-to-tail adaptor [Gordonia phage Schiebs]